MKIFIPCLLFGFCFCTGSAKKSTLRKPLAGFAVVELFTSEGCSSCPPADRLLATVKDEFADSNVLVMAYHVDYWDRLGWQDEFSSAANTNRQNFYARIFKESSIYTPQAVVNGAQEFVGSDRNKMLNAIHQSSFNNRNFTIHIKADSGKVFASVDDAILNENESLLITLIQKQATTSVRRGENAGKELSHVNIVRAFSILSGKNKSANFSLPGSDKTNFFIAVLIQNQKTGVITSYKSSAIN
jgi:hypothetical protein